MLEYVFSQPLQRRFFYSRYTYWLDKLYPSHLSRQRGRQFGKTFDLERPILHIATDEKTGCLVLFLDGTVLHLFNGKDGAVTVPRERKIEELFDPLFYLTT